MICISEESHEQVDSAAHAALIAAVAVLPTSGFIRIETSPGESNGLLELANAPVSA